MKDVQATGEAFSPPKENIQHFFYFCGSLLPSWMQILIEPTKGSMRIRIHNIRLYYSSLNFLHLLSLQRGVWIVSLKMAIKKIRRFNFDHVPVYGPYKPSIILRRSVKGAIHRHTYFWTFKELGIDSKESIPQTYVAWRVGTTTLFLLGSYDKDCSKIPALDTYTSRIFYLFIY
jgi:hypothetical protein